jgi:hypothetical protein
MLHWTQRVLFCDRAQQVARRLFLGGAAVPEQRALVNPSSTRMQPRSRAKLASLAPAVEFRLRMFVSSPRPRQSSDPDVLRRVRRLAWFGLTACAVVVGTTTTCGVGPLGQADSDLALLVILVSSWAIMAQVARYVRGEEQRLSTREESTRRETAHAMAMLAKDRVKNKLSLVAGYSEFVVNDPRLPSDLRASAQKALDGAFAAARAVDDLSDEDAIDRAEVG